VTPFELGPALAGVLATERSLGSQVTADLDGVLAVGRPDDVAAIVHNLLVNARHYASGSPVAVSAATADEMVGIRVEDQGCGLAEGELEAVFSRGRRGVRSSSAHGSGLGLFVARRLATEQGGRLWVENRTGGGACFVLELPSALPEQRVHERRHALDVPQDDAPRLSVGQQELRGTLDVVRQTKHERGARRAPRTADRQVAG
jgi:signal transduction histidine kinase